MSTPESSTWAHFEDAAEAYGYTQISNAVLRSPDVSLQAKGLYALLKSYAWQDPSSFPGVKRLCTDTGASDNSLKKYREELIEVGLLVVKRRGQGKTNLYIFKSISVFLESHPSAKQESQAGASPVSHPFARNEDAVYEDSSTTPTECEAVASKPKSSKANQQELTNTFYNQLKEQGIRLQKTQYGYHLGQFANMLKNDNPTPPEIERVLAHMVKTLPKSPKINACLALQDVRMGRDTGEAWSGPAPWEKAQTNGKPKSTLPANEQWKEGYYDKFDKKPAKRRVIFDANGNPFDVEGNPIVGNVKEYMEAAS